MVIPLLRKFSVHKESFLYVSVDKILDILK